MRRSTAWKLRLPRRREFLHDPRAFAGHPSDLLDRSLEACKLTLQVVDGRLNPITKHAAPIGKEEIASGGTNDGAD
jgi:hypothetical protein